VASNAACESQHGEEVSRAIELLAEWNHQLIQDEDHRNSMTISQLFDRMRSFLSGEYSAVIFSEDAEPVAYALYREDENEIYLRQLFVMRTRRRKGIGKKAVQILREDLWPKFKRLTVEVLTHNAGGVAFWRSVGYQDYCLTLEIMPSA
jgi:GNAT superfamily N-acetyltransferase